MAHRGTAFEGHEKLPPEQASVQAGAALPLSGIRRRRRQDRQRLYGGM